jgi:SAM-dependent methyltransferase
MHGHVHLDESHWEAFAAHTELEGEVLLGFVTSTAGWIAELRGPDAPAVWHVIDVGSGPGVGTCELARLFPEAQVVAVDGSAAMLERAARRAAALGLSERVRTHQAELPDRLDGVDRADVMWASMSLHHVGDERLALRLLRDRLTPSGLLAVSEVAESLQVLPADAEILAGRPGLVERVQQAATDWFASMRAGLEGSVPSGDLGTMLTEAGFEIVGTRRAEERCDPPLSDKARQVVVEHVRRLPHQLEGRLDADDMQALAVLGDPDDPRGVAQRDDVFIVATRQIVVARPS